MTTDLKQLFGKLNDTCRNSLDDALKLTFSRNQYNVEIEHLLLKLLDVDNADMQRIVKHFELNPSRLQTDITRTLDKLKTGNSRPPALSPDLLDLVRKAWMLASIDYGSARIRSGHILLALLADDSLRRLAHDASEQFDKIPAETLRTALYKITEDSAETDMAHASESAPEAADGKSAGPTKTPALDQFTVDLTAQARDGKIDPVLGRDPEIRQIIDILTRRRQNNPILTGEAGVGKTAVVEGFALRIVAEDVPPPLRDVSLRSLDLGLLQAGAGVKGEFENRLKDVINEVKASAKPIIMFIDEAHTMIGAGGQAGQNDAANLLKPALARGELRTIAATTWAEYKKYFEKDPALTRRFQVVKVEEPSEASAIEMMRGIAKALEKHHGVRVFDEGIKASVKLSARYIQGRQLPDKSVSLLDTACARVRLSQTATPPAVEDARREVSQLTTAIDIAERELAVGEGSTEERDALVARKTEAEKTLAEIEDRWKAEREAVDEINAIYRKLAGEPEPEPDAQDGGGKKKAKKPEPLSDKEQEALRKDLETKRAALEALQGEMPLVNISVGEQAVAEVVGAWTGIPVGRMASGEITGVLQLKEKMEEHVVGQSHALEAISESIVVSRAKMTDPNKPIGIFLMVGTSGVGKTETALCLTEQLYGGRENLTVINMSEFKEEHKVATLMGAPPGYVGYGEGGVLTEAVRRKPYSVVLLDEMEKAHPGVQDVFYQVFDKGILRDSEGRDVDFKNTVIIMTSNAGTDTIAKLCADPDTMPDASGLAEALRPDLLNTFKPAFLGRVTLVPYFPLADDVMKKIISLKIGKIERRIIDNYKAECTISPEVVDLVLSRCKEVESGARNIDNILNHSLLPQLSSEFLSRLASGDTISKVSVTAGADSDFAITVG